MLALFPLRGEGTVAPSPPQPYCPFYQLTSLTPSAWQGAKGPPKEVGLVEEGEEGLLPLQGCALLVRSQMSPGCAPQVILIVQGSSKEAFDVQA